MPDLKEGKLMLYFPDAELCDGAAENESNGFFDVYNTPPWDTWVSFFEDKKTKNVSYKNYLLFYTPKKYLDRADGGIRVNPEACISWLDDSETSLFKRFKDLL